MKSSPPKGRSYNQPAFWLEESCHALLKIIARARCRISHFIVELQSREKDLAAQCSARHITDYWRNAPIIQLAQTADVLRVGAVPPAQPAQTILDDVRSVSFVGIPDHNYYLIQANYTQ